MNKTRRMVIVQVSTQLLLDALSFPDGSEVVACVGERAGIGTIDLFVEHPDLPETDSHEIPLAAPLLTQVGEKPSSWLEFDWGLPNND